VVRNVGTARPKCVVIADDFDWQETEQPKTPLADTIIYEVHLRGMTAHSSARVQHPGTYLGLVEMIPYFKDLGVTAIELLPIQEFDELENSRRHPKTGEPLTNYWGYSTVSFFAPNGSYAAGTGIGAQVSEFKTMVREFHKHGLEIILDVVFNHTAEGNHLGPTINFKGVDNSIYYFLANEKQFYQDFSGCGNSVKSNHPVVREMIHECLRYWVEHMQVDGFRFDLASVLSRDRYGRLVSDPPLLESIAEDPKLRDTKIIAEAWDAAGAYQVGCFPGGRWAEWNGRFRDDVRQFWRGDQGKTGIFATRLTGSSDLYQHSDRRPYHSINFVTSHDGFTLNDLVSYNWKHNEENGEENRDGENNNYCYNHGAEGPTENPRIDRVRLRQMKNYLATLLLAQGVPMLLGGDEFRRTQRGNNNAYCQDNDISWFDWSLFKEHEELFRFCKELITVRKQHPIFRRSEFFQGRRSAGSPLADVNWFELDGTPKDWNHDDQTLMCLIAGRPHIRTLDIWDDDMLLLFNPGSRIVNFQLPAAGEPGRAWHLLLDTGHPSPLDIYPECGPRLMTGTRYPLIHRSMAVLRRPRHD
jgi:glycogen operon protein